MCGADERVAELIANLLLAQHQLGLVVLDLRFEALGTRLRHAPALALGQVLRLDAVALGVLSARRFGLTRGEVPFELCEAFDCAIEVGPTGASPGKNLLGGRRIRGVAACRARADPALPDGLDFVERVVSGQDFDQCAAVDAADRVRGWRRSVWRVHEQTSAVDQAVSDVR